MLLCKELDKLLLELAWSLWTELGVAGIKRKHQKFLITLEELIVVTVALAEIDPRLRDESLDWCSKYHHFISTSRLKTIMESFGSLLNEPFSNYAATLNSFSQAKWPLFQNSQPLKIVLSGKSCLRSFEAPALLNIRARALFGTGARADIMTFFLMHPKLDFSASDMVEIGYSKRNLAKILDELCLSGLFEKFFLRNQQRYRLMNADRLFQILAPVPEYAPSWGTIFELVLSLRDCITRTKNSSESTRAIEIRTFLLASQKKLQRLSLVPPPWQTNLHVYLNSFDKWFIEIMQKLAQGDLYDHNIEPVQ